MMLQRRQGIIHSSVVDTEQVRRQRLMYIAFLTYAESVIGCNCQILRTDHETSGNRVANTPIVRGIDAAQRCSLPSPHLIAKTNAVQADTTTSDIIAYHGEAAPSTPTLRGWSLRR